LTEGVRVFWCPRCHHVCPPTAARCCVCGAPQPSVRRPILQVLCFAVTALLVWLMA
jgi:hypothetical protein